MATSGALPAVLPETMVLTVRLADRDGYLPVRLVVVDDHPAIIDAAKRQKEAPGLRTFGALLHVSTGYLGGVGRGL